MVTERSPAASPVIVDALKFTLVSPARPFVKFPVRTSMKSGDEDESQIIER